MQRESERLKIDCRTRYSCGGGKQTEWPDGVRRRGWGGVSLLQDQTAKLLPTVSANKEINHNTA